MNNFSPNMLKTFQDCQKKYEFRYIQKISIPQKASFFEKGKKVHALAHYYLRGDEISKLEQALTEDERQSWECLKNNEYFQKIYVDSEYNLSAKVGEYWVGGRLDALVKSGQDYFILDYKTGSTPKSPEKDFQTMVYLLCVDKFLQEYNSLKFIYIDLKNNENHIVDFNPKIKADYENSIKLTCESISNHQHIDFVEHSKKCEYCEYKKICF